MCEYCGCTSKDVKKPLKELPLLGSEIKIVKRPKEVSLFYQNRRMGCDESLRSPSLWITEGRAQ